MDRAKDVGKYFLEALNELKEKYDMIGDVRGRGMFIGIDLVKSRETREPHTKAAEHVLSRFREERILMQVQNFVRLIFNCKYVGFMQYFTSDSDSDFFHTNQESSFSE